MVVPGRPGWPRGSRHCRRESRQGRKTIPQGAVAGFPYGRPPSLVTTLKVTLAPGETTWFWGCWVMDGGAWTTRLAARLTTLPAGFATKTEYVPSLADCRFSIVRVEFVAFRLSA